MAKDSVIMSDAEIGRTNDEILRFICRNWRYSIRNGTSRPATVLRYP